MSDDKQFLVWEPARGQTIDDAETISATDPQHAAELWAEQSDCVANEYDIARGQPAIAMVCSLDSRRTREMIVSGEWIRRYRACLRIRLVEDAQ